MEAVDISVAGKNRKEDGLRRWGGVKRGRRLKREIAAHCRPIDRPDNPRPAADGVPSQQTLTITTAPYKDALNDLEGKIFRTITGAIWVPSSVALRSKTNKELLAETGKSISHD
ncbi:unnamed protein product [Nezara viridula]|uniref:Uncharacterized protein n=1 Tax=Nezara viridula TaxID=85310 RepID=A0A9P0HBB6_NEZVI|nr:unnamed protein product [Nezara viridula]